MSVTSILVGLLLVGLGLIVALKGLELARILIPIFVGLFGFMIMLHLFEGYHVSSIVVYGVAMAVGLVFALAGYFFYKVVIVLQFAALGYYLVIALFSALNIHLPFLAFVFGVLLAIGAASLALSLSIWNYLIWLGTALNGAVLGVLGIISVFWGNTAIYQTVRGYIVVNPLPSWAAFLMWIILAIWAIGAMYYQAQSMGGFKKIKDFEMSMLGLAE